MSKRQPAADRGDDPTIKHGTVYAYDKKGCRCEDCRSKGKEWKRALPSRQRRYKRDFIEGRVVPDSVHGTPSGWSYWRCGCEACRENARLSDAKQRAKRKAEAAPTAVNVGKPWTPRDIEIAIGPGLTDLEAAKILGRTVTAVNQQRYKFRHLRGSRGLPR